MKNESMPRPSVDEDDMVRACGAASPAEVEPLQTLAGLRGIATNATGGESAVDYIARLRREQDEKFGFDEIDQERPLRSKLSDHAKQEACPACCLRLHVDSFDEIETLVVLNRHLYQSLAAQRKSNDYYVNKYGTTPTDRERQAVLLTAFREAQTDSAHSQYTVALSKLEGAVARYLGVPLAEATKDERAKR